MQIKISVNYHLTFIRMTSIKNMESKGVGKNVEKLEHLCTVGGNVKWCSNYGKSMVVSQEKFLNRINISSVAQSCPTLCGPMNCSTPGLPVHHQLPGSTQTHVHDHVHGHHVQVAKILECQPQQHSFQWIFRVVFLSDWLVSHPWKLRNNLKNTGIQ